MSTPYQLVYGEDIPEHLQHIERRYYSLIRRAIEQQLSHEPTVETGNRKPLRRPALLGAEWELRFGPGNRFRVFYRVDTPALEVHVLAIGVKMGNRLVVAGEEWQL